MLTDIRHSVAGERPSISNKFNQLVEDIGCRGCHQEFCELDRFRESPSEVQPQI